MNNYWQVEGNTLIIGNTYEEGGWYMEIDLGIVNPIRLYRIPQYGGKPQEFGVHDTITGAFEAVNKLT